MEWPFFVVRYDKLIIECGKKKTLTPNPAMKTMKPLELNSERLPRSLLRGERANKKWIKILTGKIPPTFAMDRRLRRGGFQY